MVAPPEYVDLHAHSTFSFLDGSNLPEQIAVRTAELGRYAHALTDHGNVSAHPRWEIAAHKAGVKPLFGLEAYFTPDVAWSREQKQRPTNTHMTILAETQDGYCNLLRMVTESNRGGYYYRAWVDEQNVQRHHSGLIFLSGCLSSMMSRLLVDDRLDDAIAMARYWRDMVGPDNYFLETQLFDHPASLKVNEGIMRVHLATDIPMVTTNDVHMIDGSEQQRDNRRLLHCIRDERRWEDDPGDFSYSSEYPLSPAEAYANAERAGIIGWYKHMAANTLAIAERCTVELPKSSFIEFPLPEGADKQEQLFRLVTEGAAFRGIDLDDRRYFERVDYELRLIVEKGFVDYFLVTADMVQWAKHHGILVGPARGSAAGSLVCYLLRITEINPLEWGLMFERFIDVTRSDLPDIDLDFDQERRGEIKHYFAEKYGADRVGVLGTFVRWRGRNSLDAVGRVFSIPRNTVTEVKEQIDDRTMPDGQQLEVTFGVMPVAERTLQQWPQMERAQLLEGQMRGVSTHACGLLLSSVPLDDVCATYRSGTDEVCSVDYDAATHLGLLKEDILGLKALTVIREVIDEVGIPHEEYYALPLDDQRTMEGFRRLDVAGVFQFEGVTNRYLLQRYPRVETVLDLAHITSLARPGPRQSGVDNEFMHRRNGYAVERDEDGRDREVPHPVPTVHPDVDRILAFTYGLMVYQEQLLQVGRDVGGLSWDVCNELRKAMSKKRGTAEFERAEGDFISGAGERGLPEEQARELWDSMVTFGAYAFNLSHAISYAVLAYHTMYLKQHYPAEFYAAICRHENDAKTLRGYLLGFLDRGGVILPPNINRSDEQWRSERTAKGVMAVRAGLAAIKGVGERTARLIVQNRPYLSREQLAEMRAPAPTERNPDRTAKIANVRVLEALEQAGAFNEDDGYDFLGIQRFVAALEQAPGTHKIGELTRDSDHDYVVVVGRIAARDVRSAAEVAQRRARRYNPDTGQVEESAVREVRNPERDEYVSIRVEDDTYYIGCTINRYDYPSRKKLLMQIAKEGDIVRVEGSIKPGPRWIRVEDIQLVFQLDETGNYVAYQGEQ